MSTTQAALTRLLCWLALAPTVVFLILETQVRSVIKGRLRVYNAVDLFVMTAFYHVMLEILCDMVFAVPQNCVHHEYLAAVRRGRSCRRIASALITAFHVGRSIHIASDAIHTYATEVHPEHKARVPVDMLELIYFLDEDLSHWILFISYYSLLALLTFCYNVPAQTSIDKVALETRKASAVTRGHVKVVLAGGLMGATHAVATIESSHWWLGLYGGFALSSGAFAACSKMQAGIRKAAQSNVLVLFSLSVSIALCLGLVLYRVAVGSMAQPSELGGVISVALGILRCSVKRFRFSLVC